MIQPTLIDTAPQNRKAAENVIATAIQFGADHGLGHDHCETVLFNKLLDALAIDYAKDAHVEYGIEVHEYGTTGPRIVILKTTDEAKAEENLRDLQREPALWLEPRLVQSTVVRSNWTST